MRRKQDPMQDDAHTCLLEWGAYAEAVAGTGYPSIEVAASIGDAGGRVSGGERPMSRPEAYCKAWPRWHSYNEAVRLLPPHLRPCIVRQYYLMLGEQRCADLESMSLTEWRKRRDTARAHFHASYQMLRALANGHTTHCESA